MGDAHTGKPQELTVELPNGRVVREPELIVCGVRRGQPSELQCGGLTWLRLPGGSWVCIPPEGLRGKGFEGVGADPHAAAVALRDAMTGEGLDHPLVPSALEALFGDNHAEQTKA